MLLPYFHAATNDGSSTSTLRLANPHNEVLSILLLGIDDSGSSAHPNGESRTVTMEVPPKQALMLTAAQLEQGDSSFTGNLGDGQGEWQLLLISQNSFQALSLVENESGNLANLITWPVPSNIAEGVSVPDAATSSQRGKQSPRFTPNPALVSRLLQQAREASAAAIRAVDGREAG